MALTLAVGSPRRRGFTLIEVMVAAIVLSVGILSLSALVHRFADEVRISNLTVSLSLRARSLVDSVRALGYEQLALAAPLADGTGIQVTEDSLGLKEILVIVRGDAGDSHLADTLVTRVGAR